MQRLATIPTMSDPQESPPGHDGTALGDVFRIAFEESAAGVSVVAPNGEYLHANRAFCELIGYSLDELRTLETSDLMHHDDLARAVEAKHKLLRGEATDGRWERRFVHKSGLTVWALLTSTVVRDEAGNPTCIISQVIDISDRKLAEEALQRAEARFRALIGAMQDVIIVLDRNGTYMDIAPSATEKLFRAPAHLLGRRLHDVFPPERADVFLGAVRRALESRAPVEISYELPVGADQIWFDATISPLPDDRVVWVARDVTARHLAEQALRDSEDQLRQAQKMEAVGQLAGGIAHDFNNLLMAIMSNADLAALEMPQESGAFTYIDEIKHASRRARALTQQLLAFSRKQVLQPRVLDLNAVVRDAEQILRRLIGETIALTIDLDASIGTVTADPGQLGQVLVNLCVNARDAMPGGGRLAISTRNRDIGETEASAHRGLRPGPYVELSVSDTGEGMDEPTRTRIFEPFFTTKPPGQGTGLGLSTAYGIVKQSGGYIAVSSEEGKGSIFEVFLPRMSDDSAGSAAPQPQEKPATEGRGTILLVEDESSVREAAKRMLRKYGYEVIEAANGQLALDLWDAKADSVDLVLTDVVMPAMGGAELVRHLRERRAGLKVVFMSGYTQGTLELASMDQRATRFLPKPFTADQLVGALKELLEP